MDKTRDSEYRAKIQKHEERTSLNNEKTQNMIDGFKRRSHEKYDTMQ